MLVLVASCFVASVHCLHAIVGNDVFLQGTFVNLGIHSAGSFGTDQAAPSGVGFVTSPNDYAGRVGYRFDADGFGVGSAPTTDDFLLPGWLKSFVCVCSILAVNSNSLLTQALRKSDL